MEVKLKLPLHGYMGQFDFCGTFLQFRIGCYLLIFAQRGFSDLLQFYCLTPDLKVFLSSPEQNGAFAIHIHLINQPQAVRRFIHTIAYDLSLHIDNTQHYFQASNMASESVLPSLPGKKRRIAVMTSGGDAPGMNGAVRAVVRMAIAKSV